MSTLQVTIKIRKYLWKEVVREVAFFVFDTIAISDAFSKHFFKRPIGETLSIVFFPVIWLYNSAEKIVKYALITIIVVSATIMWIVVTTGIPIVLILAALGKIS